MQCTDLYARAIGSDVTSEDSAVTFNIYDRAANDLGFLGMVQIKTVLINDHTVDQWYKCVHPLSFAPASVLIDLALLLSAPRVPFSCILPSPHRNAIFNLTTHLSHDLAATSRNNPRPSTHALRKIWLPTFRLFSFCVFFWPRPSFTHHLTAQTENGDRPSLTRDNFPVAHRHVVRSLTGCRVFWVDSLLCHLRTTPLPPGYLRLRLPIASASACGSAALRFCGVTGR